MATQIQVRFVDELPPPMRKEPTWDEALAKLKSEPGMWARLRAYANANSAANARWRMNDMYRNFEFAVRENVLYGRYVR